RSARSTKTPPSRKSARIGTVLAKLTTPNANGELVNWRTSQLKAIVWIHEPMFETKAPTQKRRKSRPRRALNTVKNPEYRIQKEEDADAKSPPVGVVGKTGPIHTTR